MKVKVVTSLSAATLRASDYVTCPAKVANEVVNDWLDRHELRGFVRSDSKQIKDLKYRIAMAIEEVVGE